MSQAAKTHTDFSNDTDADLLTIISWKGEDEYAAREALGELYRRNAPYLTAVCLRAYRRSIGDDAVHDLVSDTFLRVFRHAAAAFEPSDETDAENIRKHVRAWLGTITYNLFLMKLRGATEQSTKLIDGNKCGRIPNPVQFPSENLCKYDEIRNVIENELTARERDVLYARLWNYDVNAEKQMFDPDVLADLVEQWGTTNANIRQILSRTLRKIRDHLS